MIKSIQTTFCTFVYLTGVSLLHAAQAGEAPSVEGVEIGVPFGFGAHEFRWEKDANQNKLIDLGEVSHRAIGGEGWNLLEDEALYKSTIVARRLILQDPQPGVSYKSVPGRDLTAHVHYPEGWKASDRRPVIIWFHGGGFAGGSPRQFERFAKPLTKLGLVNIRVGYRLTVVDGRANAGAHKAAQDGRSAIRWVRKNAAKLGIDPQKIIAAGDSAGGALALATIRKDINDPQDDLSITATPNAIMGESAWVLMQKPGIEKNTIAWPILNLPKLPPIWLGYGGKDVGYKPGSPLGGEAFVKALEVKKGVQLATHYIADGDHGYGFRPHLFPLCLESMQQFLTKHGFLPVSEASVSTPRKPNLLIICADDLGYGDVQCYDPEGKMPTPQIDRLAAEGIRFTDAHTSSGVCFPSRYTLLTGRYHWRTAMNLGVLGNGGKPLISEDRLTIGSLAQQQGYRTACIGKWHVGMHWDV
jgi:hypothetical protein